MKNAFCQPDAELKKPKAAPLFVNQRKVQERRERNRFVQRQLPQRKLLGDLIEQQHRHGDPQHAPHQA